MKLKYFKSYDLKTWYIHYFPLAHVFDKQKSKPKTVRTLQKRFELKHSYKFTNRSLTHKKNHNKFLAVRKIVLFVPLANICTDKKIYVFQNTFQTILSTSDSNY